MEIDLTDMLFIAVWCPRGECDHSKYGDASILFREMLALSDIDYVWKYIHVDVPANDVHRRIIKSGWLFLIDASSLKRSRPGPFAPGEFSARWMSMCIEVGVQPIGGQETYLDAKACLTDILGIHKGVI